MGDWLRYLVRDAGAPTITTSGAATGLHTGPYRSAMLFAYVHSLSGTSATIRFHVAISPNFQTGIPASVNVGAKWAVMTQGATYSGGATGLRVISITEGAVGLFSRVGWTVAGTGPKIKASLWLGLKD